MCQRAQDIDLAPFGYAPGHSHFYCIDCNSMSLKAGHRYSIRCVSHALEERAREMAQLPPAEVLQEELPRICSQSGIFSRLLASFSSFFFRAKMLLTHP